MDKYIEYSRVSLDRDIYIYINIYYLLEMRSFIGLMLDKCRINNNRMYLKM